MMYMIQNRKNALMLVTGLLAGVGAAFAAPVDAFNEVLEASIKSQKGVVLYVKGAQVTGRVTKVGTDTVELTSREFSRVVVRKDAIDGVAGN